MQYKQCNSCHHKEGCGCYNRYADYRSPECLSHKTHTSHKQTSIFNPFTRYAINYPQRSKYAKEHGFDAFSTTLLVSPYQKHDELKRICEELSKKYDIDFLYRDFRPGFREGQNKARELELYMQKYCGCVFSEEDRYSQKIAKDIEKFKS